MNSRYVLTWVVLLMAGGSMNSYAVATEEKALSGAQAVGKDEREVTEFVIKMAQGDIGDLNEVSMFVQGDWQLARSSRNQAVGWTIHESKVVGSPSWLKSAMHEAYLKKEAAGGNESAVNSASLTIELRDGVCFSGNFFMQPKYARGDMMDSIRAQPLHGGGKVVLLSISGRDVDFKYAANNECVVKITFVGRRTTSGSVR